MNLDFPGNEEIHEELGIALMEDDLVLDVGHLLDVEEDFDDSGLAHAFEDRQLLEEVEFRHYVFLY